MVERVEWNGRRYRRYPGSDNLSDRRYFKRTFNGGSEFLHRDVWRHHNGPIPDGWHIHHIDGDTGNNDISNLQCLPPKEHSAEHPIVGKRLVRHRENLDRIRPLTKAWHASEEGREKHREIGALAWASFDPEPKPCKHCGGQFRPRKLGSGDLFCSNACKSAWRRASGLDDEVRQCKACGAAFTVNRYSKTACCSRSCAQRLRSRQGGTGL